MFFSIIVTSIIALKVLFYMKCFTQNRASQVIIFSWLNRTFNLLHWYHLNTGKDLIIEAIDSVILVCQPPVYMCKIHGMPGLTPMKRSQIPQEIIKTYEESRAASYQVVSSVSVAPSCVCV